MKFSIITVCFNSEQTIEKTILSVLSQNYNNIEFIIIDGQSKDNTLEIINNYRDKIDCIISEPDKGIYDAINKGILKSTGEIIGILNSDDEFYDNTIITKIASHFLHNPTLDSIIGDVVFENNRKQIVRNYSSKNWNVNMFSWGFMPPHPSFYCKKIIYNKLGLYKTNFKIGADFELLIRFLMIQKINFEYIALIIVRMKTGGVSTRGLKSVYIINKEILNACKINGINTNYFKLYSKYFIKIFEFLKF